MEISRSKNPFPCITVNIHKAGINPAIISTRIFGYKKGGVFAYFESMCSTQNQKHEGVDCRGLNMA
jgi:hypothetical protein